MSAVCDKCSESVFVEDAVVCGDCKGLSHFYCAGVRETKWRKKTAAEKLSWLCATCRQSKFLEAVKEKPGKPESRPGTKSIEDLYDTMEMIRNELGGVLKGISYINESFEEINTRLDNFDILRKKVDELEKKMQEKDRTITDLKSRLASSEQYQRRRQLEFTNVTERGQEDLEQVVISIAKTVGVDLKNDDIEVVHRIPNRRGKTPTVIVELASRKKRNDIFAKRYDKVVTNKSVLGAGYSENRIYISESLSPFYKNLLWQAKTLAREKQYKFCWFRNCKVYVRKVEGSPAKVIANEEDLKRID